MQNSNIKPASSNNWILKKYIALLQILKLMMLGNQIFNILGVVFTFWGF